MAGLSGQTPEFPQQLTDHQLAEQIRGLRTVIRHDRQMNAVLFPHYQRTETATEQVTRRHARLDRDAERIRTAQHAAQTAAAAAHDLAAAQAARDAAQARYDQTSRWNTRASTRTELRDARDAAQDAVTEHQDTLRAARAEAERLARATGTPPFGWAAILDDADDTAARAREIADAHRADARDDEVRDRQQRNLEHEETRLRTAVDEQHRRRALTDDERAIEHRARTTLREPDAPGTEPAAGTGTGFDPGPAPDPGRGAEHGYGL